jgi:hypothetical protein
MKLFCVVNGCPNFVEITETVSSKANFICRNHTPESPDDTRLQENQFDSDIPRGAEYIGTPEVYLEDRSFGYRINTSAPNIDEEGDDMSDSPSEE